MVIGKRRDKNDKFNFKIHDVTRWETNNYNTRQVEFIQNPSKFRESYQELNFGPEHHEQSPKKKDIRSRWEEPEINNGGFYLNYPNIIQWKENVKWLLMTSSKIQI